MPARLSAMFATFRLNADESRRTQDLRLLLLLPAAEQ